MHYLIQLFKENLLEASHGLKSLPGHWCHRRLTAALERKGEVDMLPLHAQPHLPFPGPAIPILPQGIILPLLLTM